VHTFDYSFLRSLSLSPSFATRLARIEGFKADTRRFIEDNPEISEDMTRLSMVMSAKESNSIEGISTEDERLIGLLSGRVSPRGHDEYEIIGYRDALRRIHLGHGSMEIDEDLILDLYATLVSYTGAETGYKNRNNEIVDKGPDGSILRRYKTVPAKQVVECMYQMMGAFIEARNDISIPNIMLIPCFIMDFLKIHPFMDGNGRMSRLLTVLLMYQEGLDVCSYVSIEAIINSSKADYYEALSESGEGWFDDASDYMPFIDYMIGVIFLAYREMDRRMAAASGKGNKEERIERMLLSVSYPVSKEELRILMPDISEAYISLILQRMQADGRIERIGGKKFARYIARRRTARTLRCALHGTLCPWRILLRNHGELGNSSF